jgi:hypothetical protein
MKSITCLVLCLGASIGIYSQVSSRIGPAPGEEPLRLVFQRSDIVCLCRVRSIQVVTDKTSGELNRDNLIQRRMTAILQPEESFKPATRQTAVITLDYVDRVPVLTTAPPLGLHQNEEALFFLKATSAETYEVFDGWLNIVVFNVFPRISHPDANGLDSLESELAAVADLPNGEDQLRAIRMIGTLDKVSGRTLEVLARQAEKSNDQEIALTCWRILLKNDVPEVLPKFADYLNRHRDLRSPAMALTEVEFGLSQVHDFHELPSLEELLRSPVQPIREGAVEGIRSMRLRQTAPILVQCLDDPDHMVQYQAVITLNEIFLKNGDYGPGMGLFDRDPAKYTNLWKKWWAGEGHTLFPPETDH